MKQCQVDALKDKYPQGTKVQLNYMKGESNMPFGLAGTVQFVDDAGQIHCHWENGSTLAVVPDVDSISVIPKVMEERQKNADSQEKSEEEKQIRFIDSRYKTLFTIPDGGSIQLTHSDGQQVTFRSQYIDDTHTKIGRNDFHICQFAEMMERNGSTYMPITPQEKEQTAASSPQRREQGNREKIPADTRER